MTMMRTATNSFGRKKMICCRKSLIGLGRRRGRPRTARTGDEVVDDPREDAGGVVLALAQRLLDATPLDELVEADLCRILVRIFWTNLAMKMPTMRISRK
jgi:hypothetical protein